MDNELKHYGRLGMRWGQNIFGKKEKRSRSSFNTKNNGRVMLDRNGKLLLVNDKTTDHKTQGVTILQNYKAKLSAYKEADEYMRTFKNVKVNDVLNLMGNKYVDEISNYKYSKRGKEWLDKNYTI